ncbi:LysR family transcriptional regulator [Bacillus sp. EAC]|uniref:LysR family transcriptional regulator n=1 Tax=Bacillus sp. EAC TaxID=1978338 RepID=UPI0011550D6F|nr:LysR family transcriptional regulator [Bacillus sp. EAC]
MQIDDIRLMITLAEEKNMRKAAERLFVSQPALSQRLQNLEKQIGSELFIRSQKGLIITASGEIILNYAKRMEDTYQSMLEQLQILNSDISGTLKIAVSSVVAQYWLPPVLKQYVSQFPDVQVSIFTGWSSEITNRLYENEVHLAILRGNQNWFGEKELLFSDELLLVDTKKHDLADYKEIQRPFIQFKSNSNYYQLIQSWWYEHFNSLPKHEIVVDQIETCKQFVLNGLGFAILPSSALHDVREDNLIKTPLYSKEQARLYRDTYLLYNRDAMKLKQVEGFIKSIRKKK